MIIRYTAYTTSPRADAERSRKYRERDPEGWSLGGWGWSCFSHARQEQDSPP